MESILKEIERALEARLYYLAIVMVLTLPDICAGLEANDGRTSPDRYKDWYNTNLAAKLDRMTAEDCYSLRCGVVHQGHFGGRLARYDRPLLVLPSNVIFVNCEISTPDKTYYIFSAQEFCRIFLDAARKWFAAKKVDQTVIANIPNLVQYYPTGFGPVKGTGVIA